MIKLDPALAKRLEDALHEMEDVIREDLVPQFVSSRMDPESGAILVPDWEGEPLTAGYQAGVVRTGAALEQHGLAEDDARRLATRASDFIVRHLWDADHGGWIEEAEQMAGEKLTITQAHVLAALAEFLMVSGDFEVAERAVETFKLIQVFAADNLHGGYHARFIRDWQVIETGADAETQSALAESFALAYQAIGTDIYRRRASEAVQPLLAGPQTATNPTTLRTLALLDDPVIAGDQFSSLSPESLDKPNALTCLELWRITNDTAWLTHALNFIDSASLPLPEALRMETLFLKALYGAAPRP